MPMQVNRHGRGNREVAVPGGDEPLTVAPDQQVAIFPRVFTGEYIGNRMLIPEHLEIFRQFRDTYHNVIAPSRIEARALNAGFMHWLDAYIDTQVRMAQGAQGVAQVAELDIEQALIPRPQINVRAAGQEQLIPNRAQVVAQGQPAARHWTQFANNPIDFMRDVNPAHPPNPAAVRPRPVRINPLILPDPEDNPF